MISTRIMELRKRRGLMIALVVVNIGIPSVFLLVRLLAHAFDPKSYGPAGGFAIYQGLVAGVMYIFGFIVAATLGCTAGSIDLTEGMFRHLVVTGRSRLALYLARIPAGLAVLVPIVAVGFTIVCVVCVFAAPKTLNYDGVNLPVGMSKTAFDDWAADHAGQVVCDFSSKDVNVPNLPCGPNGIVAAAPGSGASPPVSRSTLEKAAVTIAGQNYQSYQAQFLVPPVSLMIESGLWLLLEAVIGLVVGLGLGSLIGQRTVGVILMIVLEVILTPLFSRTAIPHMINLQRGVVGIATDHLEPAALSLGLGQGGGGPGPPNRALLLPETRTEAICVIVGWLVFWTAVGARRMMKRDA
jgi:hypothetical protein